MLTPRELSPFLIDLKQEKNLMVYTNPKEIRRKLADIVGEEYIISAPLTTFPYTEDASNFGGTEAEVVVRPGSTEEVSKIVSLANRERIPVVVRGGGASIYGQPEGVSGRNLLLDMTRMNNVTAINPRSMTVTAQAGIIMSKLELACRKEGFYIFCIRKGGWRILANI